MQFSCNVFWCFVNHLGAKRHLLCFGSIAAQAGVPDWKTPEDAATTLVFIAHLRRSEWIGSDREICTAKNRVNVLRLFIKDAFKFPSIEMYFLFLPPPPQIFANRSQDGKETVAQGEAVWKKINTECHKEVT